MKLIFLGPPGSGKGTYASRVGPMLGVPQISTGDLLRALREDAKWGPIIKKSQDSGGLVPDDIVFAVVDERLKKPDAENGYIFDGFPRNLVQAQRFDKMTMVDKVINMVVSDEIIIKRLSARWSCPNCKSIFNTLTLKPKVEGKCDKCGSELFQRDDDKPYAIKHRLEVYRELTEPLIEHYRKKGILRDVVCERLDIPPDEMIPKILAAINGD